MFKLKFWKHNELDDLKIPSDDELDKKANAPPTPDFNIQQSFPHSFDMQKTQNYDQMLQLISSKIDTLIAKMDNMNQRIANLERIAQEAQR